MLRVKINVELDSERIEGLMNGKIKLSRRGFRALWMYMASLQLTEYLTNIMAKYHFKFSPGKTTKAMINDMLEHFSVSESMQLIYSAIMRRNHQKPRREYGNNNLQELHYARC